MKWSRALRAPVAALLSAVLASAVLASAVLASAVLASAVLASAVLASAVVTASAGAQEISNPDLFLKSLEAAAQALRYYGAYDDPEELERVNRIGYELALHSGYDQVPFSFNLVEMPVPNAFALPAGHIFITRGMLDLGLSDDMLAGLLGHEIAHVTQQHFLSMRKRATLLQVLSQLVTIGAMAAAANNRSDPYLGPHGYGVYDDTAASLAQGAAVASLAVSELLLRSYSRDNEDESDEEGQRMAAAAGYDPAGTRELMAKMQSRIPQGKAYGYWQTHPFFEERVRAAEARQRSFKIQEETKSADAYRQATQRVLLGFLERRELAPPLELTLKGTALVAWPQGEAADRLRTERLHRLREHEKEKRSLNRDYGRLREAYRKEMETIAGYTPESPALATLDEELAALESEARELYPRAVEVIRGEIFETPFLVSFLSNYPDADEVPLVSLNLGLAYSRLGREAAAVESFLRTWREAPQSEEGRQAITGLRNLAPGLTQLGGLAQLAEQEDDQEIRRLAAARLEELASTYKELQNGADYLKRFPDGDYAEVVNERLNTLAENTYREMVLYQRVGDTAKALERAKRILTFAPFSPAAEKLTTDDVSLDPA